MSYEKEKVDTSLCASFCWHSFSFLPQPIRSSTRHSTSAVIGKISSTKDGTGVVIDAGTKFKFTLKSAITYTLAVYIARHRSNSLEFIDDIVSASE